MNRKRYMIIGIIMVGSLGAVIAWAINLRNPVLALVAVIVTVVLLNLLKSRVTEVMEDERIYRISEKASRTVFQIVVLGLAMAGVVLISMKNEYPELGMVGLVLAFVACALLILYLIFYAYYRRRLE